MHRNMKKSRNPASVQKTQNSGGSFAANCLLKERINCPMHAQGEFFPYSPSNKVTVEYSGRYPKKLHSTYRGRLVKQGRLAAPAPKLTFGFKSEFSRSNGFVLGGPGPYKTVTEYVPPGQLRDKQKRPASQATNAPPIGRRADLAKDVHSPEEKERSSSDSSRKKSDAPIGLTESKPNLNLKINNLGPEFKRNKVLERLKLLETERNQQGKDDPAEENIVTRPCSTCKNSLDFLECSKEDNQRKSIAKWKARDDSDIERAVRTLNNSVDMTAPTQAMSHDAMIPAQSRSSDSKKYQSPAVPISLIQSKPNLNLKINNLGPDFKRNKVLERLKLLESERNQEGTDPEEISPVEEGDVEIRPCSTCRNSLDFLECSQKDNQRKSIAMWKSRDNDDIERAVRALNSSVDTTPTQVMSPAQSAKGSYNVVEYPLSANTSKNSTSKINSLHQSKVQLNLKIGELGPNFKNKKIIQRIKLLELERAQVREDASGRSSSALRANEPQEIEIRKCSTCKNSLDLLQCSNEENQRKSFAMWLHRADADVDMALKVLESKENSVDGKEEQRKDNNSKTYSVMPSQDDPVSLHESKVAINLKIGNLGDEFKKKRILNQLKLLKSDRENVGSDLAYNENDENEENTAVRSCSTCKKSIDLLRKSKEIDSKVANER